MYNCGRLWDACAALSTLARDDDGSKLTNPGALRVVPDPCLEGFKVWDRYPILVLSKGPKFKGPYFGSPNREGLCRASGFGGPLGVEGPEHVVCAEEKTVDVTRKLWHLWSGEESRESSAARGLGSFYSKYEPRSPKPLETPSPQSVLNLEPQNPQKLQLPTLPKPPKLSNPNPLTLTTTPQKPPNRPKPRQTLNPKP